MAVAKDIRKLVGKLVRFKSNRTYPYVRNIWTGKIEEQVRRETCIDGSWHDTGSIEIIEILKKEEDL